jgi:hypothetical protein
MPLIWEAPRATFFPCCVIAVSWQADYRSLIRSGRDLQLTRRLFASSSANVVAHRGEQGLSIYKTGAGKRVCFRRLSPTYLFLTRIDRRSALFTRAKTNKAASASSGL